MVSQTLAGWEHHQVVKLTGTGGAIWASWSGALDRTPHPSFWLKIMRGDKVEEIPISKKTGEVYELVDQLEMLIRSIREGRAPTVTGEDGRWAVRLCLAAQRSVDERRLVSIDEVS